MYVFLIIIFCLVGVFFVFFMHFDFWDFFLYFDFWDLFLSLYFDGPTFFLNQDVGLESWSSTATGNHVQYELERGDGELKTTSGSHFWAPGPLVLVPFRLKESSSNKQFYSKTHHRHQQHYHYNKMLASF